MQYKKKKVMTMAMLILTLMSAAVCNPVSVEATDTAEKTVTARIPVACEKVDSEETFRYQLKGNPSKYEEIEQTELELKSGEKGYFQISYHYPGTYYYTVSQIAGTDEKTTYDSTEYQVDVCVTESENGELFAQPILYQLGSEKKKAELVFKNTREVPKAPEKTGVTKQAKTGDTENLSLWGVILVVSGIVLVIGFLREIKRRREEKEHA